MHRQKVKPYLFSLIGVFLLLCSACSEKDSYDVVSSDDILPKAKKNYDYSEDVNNQDTLQLNDFEQNLKDSIPNVQFSKDNKLLVENTRFMPNQLGYEEKIETYFTLDTIPYHFIEWTFKDSSKTVNAFYNWLDCFGNDCRSIKINEEVNGCKQAFVVWVSHTKISYLESTEKITEKKWENLFFNKKGAWNYSIQQAPNRKINWLESSTKKL